MSELPKMSKAVPPLDSVELSKFPLRNTECVSCQFIPWYVEHLLSYSLCNGSRIERESSWPSTSLESGGNKHRQRHGNTTFMQQYKHAQRMGVLGGKISELKQVSSWKPLGGDTFKLVYNFLMPCNKISPPQ